MNITDSELQEILGSAEYASLKHFKDLLIETRSGETECAVCYFRKIVQQKLNELRDQKLKVALDTIPVSTEVDPSVLQS